MVSQAGPPVVTPDQLAARFEALARFIRVVSPYLDGASVPGVDPLAVPAAQALIGRARARIALGQGDPSGHTVVALAGTTGSGKSSLFNAITGTRLSATGPLRPTTELTHACGWGSTAGPLLDWLGITPADQTVPATPVHSGVVGEPPDRLHGLILLDLPDMDSVAPRHRIEVDRLLHVVDLVIWVVDPQKYADASVHEEYLGRLTAVRDVTAVVFNQIDRLGPADAARCLADLRRLITADGLPAVPLLATSTVTGFGLDRLRGLLARAVTGRLALVRLEAELQQALTALAPLVGTGPGTASGPVDNSVDWRAGPVDGGVDGRGRPVDEAVDDRLGRAVLVELAREFATAAGVTALAAEAAHQYLRRAAVPGWPVGRRRVDPERPRPGSTDPAAGAGPARPDQPAKAATNRFRSRPSGAGPANPYRSGLSTRDSAAVRGNARRANPGRGKGSAQHGWPSATLAFTAATDADTEVPPADPARIAAAVRRLVVATSAGLPAPWPDQIRLAADTRAGALPDELGQAVRGAHPGRPDAYGWWLLRAVWWIAAGGGVAGVGWAAARTAGIRWVPVDTGRIGPGALIASGAGVAVLVLIGGRMLAVARALRWQAEVERRLREAMLSLAREAVAPVRVVLRDHAAARSAFAEARPPTPKPTATARLTPGRSPRPAPIAGAPALPATTLPAEGRSAPAHR